MKELKERTKNYCDRMIEVAVNGDECTKQDLTIEVCKFGKDLGKESNRKLRKGKRLFIRS